MLEVVEMLSFACLQGIAGNIVPAISTTNAIVAGIQVSQAIKIITSPSQWGLFTCTTVLLPLSLPAFLCWYYYEQMQSCIAAEAEAI